MDPSHTEEPEALPAVVFGRSSKKRKAYRQRGGESTTTDEPATAASTQKAEKDEKADDTVTPTQPQPASADDDDKSRPEKDGETRDGQSDDSAAEEDEDEDDRAGISVAELIRRRKTRKPKIGGVGFRDETTEAQTLSRYADMAVDDMDLDFASDPMAMGVQFVPQTGTIGELVNKHMEEYVDAQLAKRHRAEAEQANLQPGGQGGIAGSGSGAGLSSGPSATSIEARQQLATKGKLHEIDLGAEARARNIAMTERATQRLRGEDDGSPSEAVRLGRDGKPLRRKRRGSDDIKRDQMVEQFLHENRMDVDVYDPLRDAPAASSSTTTEGRPTDDRIAEQFRREFMEAVAQRMRRKRKPLGPPAKPKTRNEEEILRGPKLGGSRNVRSVMRDKLLQKQEEERHNMPKYEQQLQEQKRRMIRRR